MHIETDDEGRYKMCFISFGFTVKFQIWQSLRIDIQPASLHAIRFFPNAIHGDCCRNLMMNCKIEKPKAYKKLEEDGFETWSRAMWPADRCNYMTSNSAESKKNLTRQVRKAPIRQLMEWYKALLQKWYCAHRDKYKDSDTNTLSNWATHKVIDRMKKSAHWKLSGIPCGHVIAVSRKMGCTDFSRLAFGRFRKTTLYSTYQDLVYPVGKPSSWVRPDGLQVVKPPNINFHIAGRPKNTYRIKSQGEEPIQVRCSKCGVHRHNKTACHEPVANYQDLTQPRLKRSRQTRQESNIHVDLGNVRSQEYETAYTNNYVRSQEYEAAYTNNYVRSQEYEAAYTNNYVRSQEYEAAYTNHYVNTQEYEAAYNNMDSGSQGYRSTYNNMNGSLQGYEAAYTNFHIMFEQANINFGG
uniref:Transposase, MuDR, MULE transposase domain protein n=1 Tax=Tanacetum cinerariifolium TaxID=118510 RepID=A0A699HIH3_TANCI|nr:hypothetical protein [Tanacetum cinerariifolium]